MYSIGPSTCAFQRILTFIYFSIFSNCFTKSSSICKMTYTHHDHWTNNKTFKIWNESMCTLKREKTWAQNDVLINHFSRSFSLISPNAKRKESWDTSLELYHLNHMILKIDFIGAVAIIWSFSRVVVKIKWCPKYLLISRMEGKNNE